MQQGDFDYGQAGKKQDMSDKVAPNATDEKQNAKVVVLEQPASRALRFRYECEGRSAGSLQGVNSTPEKRTFPTICIEGYKGPAVVVVSCVTKDPPYRPHPHNLVGKEGCKRGICTQKIDQSNMTCVFSNLGIQCVKRRDIESSLSIREQLRVDPFNTGFHHISLPGTIDLNVVRLCFQVFIEGLEAGKFVVPLEPVVSVEIYDKKAVADLVIIKSSHHAASVAGGLDMILLCEKINKDDIKVRFFEECQGQVVWEAFGEFGPSDVHKQVALSLRTPSYCALEIKQPIHVMLQLFRPSDGATSECHPFKLMPLFSDDCDIPNSLAASYPQGGLIKERKRKKHASHPSDQSYLKENLTEKEEEVRHKTQDDHPEVSSQSMVSLLSSMTKPAAGPPVQPVPNDGRHRRKSCRVIFRKDTHYVDEHLARKDFEVITEAIFSKRKRKRKKWKKIKGEGLPVCFKCEGPAKAPEICMWCSCACCKLCWLEIWRTTRTCPECQKDFRKRDLLRLIIKKRQLGLRPQHLRRVAPADLCDRKGPLMNSSAIPELAPSPELSSSKPG